MTNRICSECGMEQEETFKFCKNCGALLSDENEVLLSNSDEYELLNDVENQNNEHDDSNDVKTCPKCGTEQENFAKFCRNCGELLPDENEIETQNIGNNSSNEKSCPKCGIKQEISAKFCRNCGASLDDGNNKGNFKCVYCGAELTNEEFCPDCGKETGLKICPNCRQVTVNEDYCSICGYRINKNIKKCYNCGSTVDSLAKVCAKCGAKIANRSPFKAFILSFIFPGLGQLYNYQKNKAITIIIGNVISFLLILIFIGMILIILIWFYAMYDAYTTAKALNNGEFVEDRVF